MCSVGLGVLTEEIPPEFVDEVVELSRCREKRHRLLPARAVVYFVLGYACSAVPTARHRRDTGR